jgi:hypothetical protein
VTVIRRYNDFLALHEILAKKYLFRMVPDMPPKRKLGGKFVHERRCAFPWGRIAAFPDDMLIDLMCVRVRVAVSRPSRG